MKKIDDLSCVGIYQLKYYLCYYGKQMKFFIEFFEGKLENSKIKISSIDELKYIKPHVSAIKKLIKEIDSVNQIYLTFRERDEDDDHTSVWGGAGPDCILGRLATAEGRK